MPWVELAHAGVLTALVAATMVVLLWLISIPLRDVSIIDMAFSALIAALVLVAYFTAGSSGPIAALSLLLIFLWSARMSIYLIHRNWGHGEDPRYTRLRQWAPEGWPFYWLSLRQVFLLQGVTIWVLTLPQQIMMVTGNAAEFGVFAAIGLGLWCVGFYFETVGDYQLSKFKADATKRGTVLNTGLWRYTRHPNYFGELCQWWGLFLIAIEAPWAWLGVIGPIMYSWLVMNVTGQRTLDKKLTREKPAYANYMRTTSGLIPRPPLES